MINSTVPRLILWLYTTAVEIGAPFEPCCNILLCDRFYRHNYCRPLGSGCYMHQGHITLKRGQSDFAW